MKFVMDAQLPPALREWLEARGHEAEHVAQLGLLDAADEAIAAYAERTGSILITKDEDFTLLRLPDRFALLWLRCGNSTNRALAAWLETRWSTIEALLAGGEGLIEVR